MQVYITGSLGNVSVWLNFRPDPEPIESKIVTGKLIVRDCLATDIAEIAAIYRIEVLNHVATFELDPPDAEEMSSRYSEVIGTGYPWLIAEMDGQLAGYAYAGPYRNRPAFRNSVENSIYVAPAWQGRGIGRRLLAALITECEARGFRQMIAVISDQTNLASIALHKKAGFEEAGTWKSVGWKFGRWLDCIIMQRALGVGDSEPPEDR